MSAPQVPPRPARIHHHPQAPAGLMNIPPIPPRPENRTVNRSRSPSRDNFPRSPLNEIPPNPNVGSSRLGIGLSSNHQHADDSNAGLPPRPPSVSLPSIGQEGSEYADIIFEKPQEEVVDPNSQTEPEQTRNIDSDLPLYAPRPSLSTLNAKARVATVTRTDSVQAAAVGIGKAGTPVSGDEKSPPSHPLRSKVSFSRPDSSISTEQPSSTQTGDNEHGIPEIGQRVPMYPDAGDVQAPTPSPFPSNPPSGISSHNEGSRKQRHHSRTRSGREVFRGPPGSYGIHGHGVPHNDQFEKAWYDKHPDALLREESGQYGPGISGGRAEWALSSDDLNKIVRDTARRRSGFGTSGNVELPNEQIGYIATEEYASRINTPSHPLHHSKTHSNHSQIHVESPLRKASFPVDEDAKAEFDKSQTPHALAQSRSEHAVDSETEDDDIHIDPPSQRTSKYTGNGYDPPTEDLGPHGGNTDAEGGWVEENGYGVPILASDEIAKEPGFEYQQPAVSPVQERRGSTYYAGVDSDIPPPYQSGFRNNSLSGSAANSRPSSRPVSIHGSLPVLSRFTSHDEREDMHTPLEDVEEYEPLFPEEEHEDGRRVGAAERFKRREMMKRRFPSQDIWEDTPNSLQLQATVETPEPLEEKKASGPTLPAPTFETSEAEAARKGEVDEDEKVRLISKDERLAKSTFKPHVYEELHRPGLKQRFPSRDIWEDSPDSAFLEATVGGPGDEPSKNKDEGLQAGAVVHTTERPDKMGAGEPVSDGSIAEKSSVPPRPNRSKVTGDSHSLESEALPPIPARPSKRLHPVPPGASHVPTDPSPTDAILRSPTEIRKVPMLPDRPKPQVPPRPIRSVANDSSETPPLNKIKSIDSTDSATLRNENQGPPSLSVAVKPKPALPSRPVGGKIASIKASFLSDLDKRLQLGPQGPKPQDPPSPEKTVEKEKEPLSDARKGRAKGPARRKPASSSASTASTEHKAETRHWSIQEPWTLWQTDDAGGLDVVPARRMPTEAATKAGEPDASNQDASMIPSPVKEDVHSAGSTRAFSPAEMSSVSRQESNHFASPEDGVAADRKESVNSFLEKSFSNTEELNNTAHIPLKPDNASIDTMNQTSGAVTATSPRIEESKLTAHPREVAQEKDDDHAIFKGPGE